MINNIIEELKWRNILKDTSNHEKIIFAQNEQKAIYCGFDPTNVSLHLGNLLQVILLRRFALFGLQPIALIGGATGMIGDPSGKSQERNLLAFEQLQNNINLITKQLNKLITLKSIHNYNSLDLIEEFNLLSKDDINVLNMIIKSINLNHNYKNSLMKVLAKLPLPLLEINLTQQETLGLYQVLKLDSKVLINYWNLTNLDFNQLLEYLEQWKSLWNNFLLLVQGQEQDTKVKDIKILNNYQWLSEFNILTFLRDVGKSFNVNQMLSKENIATRLESGISYSEFSYQILQAYDFYYLYQNYGCYLQSGGSDQWGNIVAGIDFIRKNIGDEHHAAGLTINLLTNSAGKKFGKTEKGAVFLDSSKTSTYEFYQFLLNQEDNELLKLFNSLTFFSQQQVTMIMELQKAYPEKRIGQKILASVLTVFVHNISGLFQATRVTNALFNGEINKLQVNEILEIFQDGISFEQNEDDSLINTLIKYQIVDSKREARQLLNDGAIFVNGVKVVDENWILAKTNAINQTVTLLKKGKKKYYLIFHKY